MASRYPGSGEPRLQTQNMNHNPRFSYALTPTQHQGRVFEQFSSPTNSTIDESPTSPETMQKMPRIIQTVPITFFPSEKTIREEPRSPFEAPQNMAPPSQVHPAHFAPYADSGHPQSQVSPSTPTTTVRYSPYEKQSQHYPSPPAFEPEDMKKLPPTPRTPRTPTYNPHSLAGPNIAPENHMPGQIAHPNSSHDPDWQSGLCAADSACCTGFFCPCILYGKTQYRLSQRAHKKDGTDLLGYKAFNGSCALMGFAFCFSGVFASIQRTRIRKLYDLHGGITDDCMKCFCCCCMLMQNEREMKTREERLRRFAGPASGAYVMPGQMTYAPPPR